MPVSMTTSIPYSQTIILSLPPPKPDQTYDSVAERGLEVARSLIQHHQYMLDLSPLHIRHEEIPATADQAVNVEKLATDFEVHLADTPGEQRVNGGNDWHHYEIHDHIPVMFGYKKEIVFRSALRTTSTGLETLTDPGSTVTVYGRYDVMRSKDDPTTLTLIEHSITRCNILLGWYIKATLGNSHGQSLEMIKARFVEEMRKET